ncbi:PAS domain S-box protein [Anaeroselena agilis]|uniref:histidine kinase n=1 Tax=Anaeroselena agilis TaxID=3063788 RepID=A0ABU3NZ57_9FIRM|nr:PAS domain S-box protein [Selenomonadales bacterium 4137-cl]
MEKAKKHASAELAMPRPFFTPSDFVVFNQAHEAILLHNVTSGAIVTMNDKARDMFGLSPDDARNPGIGTLPPGEYPFTAEEAQRRFREAAAGNSQLFEWKARHKSGRDFWVEGFLKRVNIGEHEFVMAIFRDITRRKLSEQRLLLEHGNLTLLKDSFLDVLDKRDESDLLVALAHRACALVDAPYGFIYIYDEASGALELKVPEVGGPLSPAVAPGEGLVGRVWQTGEPAVEQHRRLPSDPEEGREAEPATVAVPLRRGSQMMGVLGLYSPDEDYHFREDEVSLLTRFADLAAVAFANATEHGSLRRGLAASKAAEDALRESEERYRMLFNSINDIIVVAEITPDGLPGLIIDANDTACRRLGYRREELLQRTPVDIVPLEFRGDTREKIELLYAQRHTLNESAYLTSDDQTIPVEVNSHLIHLDERPCVVSIAHDISERKRVEKEIARLDRLNLIGAMAAGIGHEIRNPLTTVRGFLQMLSNKQDLARHSGHFELMIQELDRANAIITEFLSLAKNKAVDLKEGNLNDVIAMLLPLLEAGAILYNKTVKTDLAEIPSLPLDEKEIRQLIINLARNGLDAMPPGGTLTIRTFCEEDQIILSVQDQGRGIPPDLADKIGTPFFTTKEYGVGLGLAVCYSIAARHNAAVSFDSGAGGTTFTVTFPVVQM